jgi:hypothetical protein
VTRTLAVHTARRRLLPSARHARRAEVCRASDLLAALGVRVHVLPPPEPWPRSGRLIVSDSAGWLGDLAVTSSAAGTPVVTASIAQRVAPAGATLCPVSVRYRLEGRPGYLDPDQVPRSRADVAAWRGLVVEVRCLPAG